MKPDMDGKWELFSMRMEAWSHTLQDLMSVRIYPKFRQSQLSIMRTGYRHLLAPASEGFGC